MLDLRIFMNSLEMIVDLCRIRLVYLSYLFIGFNTRLLAAHLLFSNNPRF